MSGSYEGLYVINSQWVVTQFIISITVLYSIRWQLFRNRIVDNNDIDAKY